MHLILLVLGAARLGLGGGADSGPPVRARNTYCRLHGCYSNKMALPRAHPVAHSAAHVAAHAVAHPAARVAINGDDATCTSAGGQCDVGSGQCCSKACVLDPVGTQRYCGNSDEKDGCLASDNACSQDGDCCTNYCQNKVCVPPTADRPTCTPSGESCTATDPSQSCCGTATCQGGICAAPVTCAGVGTSCDASSSNPASKCCSLSTCMRGTCISSATCSTRGDGCGDGHPCCSPLSCYGGQCQPCRNNATPCTFNADCCSNICSPTGKCTAKAPSPLPQCVPLNGDCTDANGNPTKPCCNGQCMFTGNGYTCSRCQSYGSCDTGNPTVCCSNQCGVDDDGDTVCFDGNGGDPNRNNQCTDNGAPCADDFQCCYGACNGTCIQPFTLSWMQTVLTL